jgi:hypothetical protein
VNEDLRLQQYLSAQADAISLTPADPAGAMRRGARRRNQRRGGVLAAVAVLGLVATSVAVYDSGDPSVNSLQASVRASSYDWATVAPASGLGYSNGLARLSDGTVYSLSTAPGTVVGPAANSQRLYRSGDDKEWTEVSLPDGVSPSALAASGDTLYAVGTAPAGGGTRNLVLASSTDGAGTWATVTLPDEIADLEARFPGKIDISAPIVAAHDGMHQVAAVTVTASLNPADLIEDLPADASWEITPGGIRVYAASDGDCAKEPDVRCARGPGASGMTGVDRGPLLSAHTWAELGVDPELQALIPGRAFLYASDDGQTFTRSSLPSDPGGWGGQLIATPDGYRYFVSTYRNDLSVTTAFASTDGHEWTSAGEMPGSHYGAGVLGGRPALALYGDMGGGTVIQVQQDDGTWLPLDLRSAVQAPDGGEVWVGTVAFGPLGLAADLSVVDDIDRPEQSRRFIVHSEDGTNLSLQELTPELGYPMGLSVSADAITVRTSDPDDRDSDTPPTQTLFIGTPAG